MNATDLPPLPVARYLVRLRALEPASLPGFLGSTLRGAFGHALKKAVCIMDHRDCDRCLVVDRCVYPYLFETPFPDDLPQMRGQERAPHPFILVPPVLSEGSEEFAERCQVQAGRELQFGLTLMGPAIQHLPYVIFAISEMARHGLGVDRARFELSDVALIENDGSTRSIYSGQPPRLSPHKSAVRNLTQWVEGRLAPLPEQNSVTLRFLTPARIRVAGGLQTGLSFELLVRNLLRRLSMLAAVHGDRPLELDFHGMIARAAEIQTSSASLRWCDWERYSNRQQTKMKLGGFLGETEYTGDLNEFLPLVAAGEILHVGGSTSFGLGRYEVVS